MSAFIVSKNCMKHIIYNLFWDHEFKRMDCTLQHNGYRVSEDFNRLFMDFYKMNQEAVKYRYSDCESDYAKIPVEGPVWDGDKLDKYQALKSMECLRYQCSEGKIPETKLYKFLDELITAWQSYIISEIPEYIKAKWD